MRNPHNIDNGLIKLTSAIIVLDSNSHESRTMIVGPIAFLISFKLFGICMNAKINNKTSAISGINWLAIKYFCIKPLNKIMYMTMYNIFL